MKEYKKYFEFSGTISGTNYFLRNLLSSLVAFIGGYLIGYGVASQIIGYTTVGLFVIAPTLWYNFATIYKRASAVFPGKGTGWTVAVLISQISVTSGGGSISFRGMDKRLVSKKYISNNSQ